VIHSQNEEEERAELPQQHPMHHLHHQFALHEDENQTEEFVTDDGTDGQFE
jgi:hypothetical protein